MPSISFVLPHWLFWAGLAVFPLIAAALVAKTRDDPSAGLTNRFLAYLFWFFGGFLGLHRIYLKSLLGLVYLPVFFVILYGNSLVRDGREEVSKARSDVSSLQRLIDRAKPAAERGELSAKERLADADTKMIKSKAAFSQAEDQLANGTLVTRAAGILTLLMLLADAILIPGMVRRLRATEKPPVISATEPTMVEDKPPDFPGVGGRIARAIDTLVRTLGELAAYWAVLAVFAYYYEVIGRYVFNSPTNWVHESTFLMFGMQYMIAGAYAYRGESHVRVDLLYTRLSKRGKAICDLFGSLFFFFFASVMLWTGWIFASDAMRGSTRTTAAADTSSLARPFLELWNLATAAFSAGEKSFTEWGIQYWPVKLMIPIGAALIILQGIARLLKDIHTLTMAKG